MKTFDFLPMTRAIVLVITVAIVYQLHAQSPRELFMQLTQAEDPNFYEVVATVDASLVPDSLESEEEYDEEFNEMYLDWKTYWKNKVAWNDTNPGSLLPFINWVEMNHSRSTCTSYPFGGEWEFIGPDVDPLKSGCPGNGRKQELSFVQSLWVNPSDYDHIRAVVPASGLWETTNGGENWISISKGATGYSEGLQYRIQSFAVKPDDHDVIYVAAEIGAHWWAKYFVGIFFTTDGGDTWQQDNSFVPASGMPALSPSKVATLKFGEGSNSNYLYALGLNHVYRKDLNLTSNPWSELHPSLLGIPNSTITDPNKGLQYNQIAIDPDYPDRMFILREHMWGDPQEQLGDLLISGNAGASWTSIVSYFEDSNNDPVNPILGKFSIPIGSRDIYVLLSTATTDGPTWVYKGDLDDFPNISWQLMGAGTYPASSAVHLGGLPFVVSSSKSSATGNPIIYAPTDCFRWTDNYGQTYKGGSATSCIGAAFNCGYNPCTKHADIRDLKLMSSDPQSNNGLHDLLFMATDGGVSVHRAGSCDINTTDPCHQCIENINGQGLCGTSTTDFDIDPFNPGNIVYSAMHHAMNERVGNDWHNWGDQDTYQAEYVRVNAQTNVLWSKGGGDGSSSLQWTHSLGGSSGLSLNYSADPYFAYSGSRKLVQVHANGYVYLGGHNLMKAPVADALSFSLISNSTAYNNIFNPKNSSGVGDFGGNWSVIAAINAGRECKKDAQGEYVTPYECECPNSPSTIPYYDPNEDKCTCWCGDPAPIQAFHVNESNPNYVYVAFPGPAWKTPIGAIATTDGGQTWQFLEPNFNTTNLDKPFDHFEITDIRSNPSNPDDVLLAFGGVAVNPNGTLRTNASRVLRSSDGGDSWCDISNGLPPLAVTKVLYFEPNPKFIFATTESGIYLYETPSGNPCSGTWKCLNNGLPPTHFGDIEIDYCQGKVIAAAGNWGFWSWYLPPEISQNTTEQIYISSSTTWSGINHINKDVIVQSGVTLTVTGTVNMAKERKITVDEGGTLVVNGGTLTNACGALWGGVEVWGNPLFPHPTSNILTNHPYHGLVHLKNGSLIENARTGVALDNMGYGGGIIIASGATFRNCGKHVVFARFRPSQTSPPQAADDINRSSFTLCTFETTDAFPNTSPPDAWPEVPELFVYMDDVSGIVFRGCEFRATAFASEHHGIKGVRSSFKVLAYWNPVSQVHTDCRFENLNYGIEAYGTGGIEDYVAVWRNTFVNVTWGIVISGAPFTDVHSNMFLDIPLHGCGFRSIVSPGFSVQDNYFVGQINPGANHRGAVVWNSGNVGGKVKHNSFNFNHASMQSERNNGAGNLGLAIECNEFVQPKYSLVVSPEYPSLGSLKNQRTGCASQFERPGNDYISYCMSPYFHEQHILTRYQLRLLRRPR